MSEHIDSTSYFDYLEADITESTANQQPALTGRQRVGRVVGGLITMGAGLVYLKYRGYDPYDPTSFNAGVIWGSEVLGGAAVYLGIKGEHLTPASTSSSE